MAAHFPLDAFSHSFKRRFVGMNQPVPVVFKDFKRSTIGFAQRDESQRNASPTSRN